MLITGKKVEGHPQHMELKYLIEFTISVKSLQSSCSGFSQNYIVWEVQRLFLSAIKNQIKMLKNKQ